MVLVQNMKYWLHMPLGFVQSIMFARSWEKLPSFSWTLRWVRRRRRTVSLPPYFLTEGHSRAAGTMLVGSLSWAVLSLVPQAEGTMPAAEAPLLPCVPCASVLQHQTQAFLCLPLYYPVFLLLSGFLLFMSLVKSRLIRFRVPVFSLSWRSFISEPLPSFSCLTWSICKSLSYSP